MNDEDAEYGATVDGLVNDEALLVTVVAADQDQRLNGGTALYTYQVQVHGPSDDLHFELEAGPDGMTIDANTGLISWNVPDGAKGDWVRVLVTAEGEHQLEQDFYLHVHRQDHFPSATGDVR